MIASIVARGLNKIGLIHRYKNNDLIPISKFNTSFRTSINGMIFKIPVINKVGWENLFLTEGWFNGLLRSINARQEWTVIDIGANIGQTLLKVKSIDKDINYLGFEPNPVCVNYLNKLIESNNLKNTILFPSGVSDKTGLLTFYYFSDSDADPAASIIQGYNPEVNIRKKNIVPVFKINDIPELRELNRIDLIKIDVEGAELEVLSACTEIIRKFKPFIIIEILPVYSAENKIRRDRQEKIEALINQLNYKIYLIRKGAKESFEKIDNIDSIGIHGNILDIDYLLVPE